MSRGRWVCAAVLSAGAVVAALLHGCGGPQDFPPNLTFTPRTDRLVLRTPDRTPPGENLPGRLDAELAALDPLGGRTLDPTTLPAEPRSALDRFLADTFGTPASPTVNTDGADSLGLTAERLKEGGRLYRRHCLQCHGLTGDGRGPTGAWIQPHPRDFRRGSFKFVTTADGGKPRRDDLIRTIRDGVKGTAMPPFALLPAAEHDLLAGFTTYLATRGQVEFQTLAALATDESGAADDAAGFARDRLAAVLKEWAKAEALPVPPAPPPGFDDLDGATHEAAVRRGFDLFTAKAGAGCAACHEDFGRTPTLRYDVWGEAVRPANLTAPGYKGGGRPEDLYARVRHGVTPSAMPAAGPLADPQVWDVVRFVRSLPYPRELPEDVRAAVHPAGR